MKSYIKSILFIFLLIFIALEIITDSNSIIESINFSFNIWKNNIFPSLFPFFILSEIFIYCGFIEFVSEFFKPIMNYLFKINSKCAFVFIMSIISGFPSNAKYTKELYDNNLINEYEASKILTFSHFSNPLFIMGTISTIFLNNKEVGILILFCHYISNLLIGIIFRNYHPSKIENKSFSLKKAIKNMNNKRINNDINFVNMLTNSIINSINTLLLILGTITVFLVITTIIDNNINLNSFHQGILNGFFEMTQGLKYISLLDIPLKIKATISTMIISFGGLSVHMQVIGILNGSKIKYTTFLIARIIHAFISSFLVFILFDIFISFI